MRIIGNVHVDDVVRGPGLDQPVASAVLERFEAEMARVQGLNDQAIEALCTIIDADSALDVARKLYRFVIALACPSVALARAFGREPGGFNRFCLHLSGYRDFLTRLEQGASPHTAAGAVERARRDWLMHELGECGDEPEDEPVDVYDAEGFIDAGAVRAEIDRLLRRLNVAPERIGITVLPDGFEVPCTPEG